MTQEWQSIQGKMSVWLGKLAPRERKLVLCAAALGVLALLWLLLLGPALRTISQARSQLPDLERELVSVQMAAEKAKVLQGQNPVANPPTANSLMQDIQECFGARAQAQMQADKIVVTLSQVTPTALARCLQTVDVHSADIRRTDGQWSGQFSLLVPVISS